MYLKYKSRGTGGDPPQLLELFYSGIYNVAVTEGC